ncbi:MAG: 16S rRNA (cytosine(967)-C(5))-methyltransferase RsmB [Nitrospira sp. CR1.3]|nr:16S rRNA (cytosine(967)-C(5))-methyltransferase RsmB [Nitrospira sp. CR1.3]
MTLVSGSGSARQIPSSARAVALSVLAQSVRTEDGVDLLLDREIATNPLDSRDRALAVELSYGVLRHRGTIDWRLQPVTDKPLRRLPILVQMILRLGAYQLLYLDRIPPSAAVNESVQLAKINRRVLGRDWSGLVNAVLRVLLREPARSWPVDAAKSLAVRHSVPEWLAQRWIDRHGISTAEILSEQASSIPPVTLRVNRLKVTREELLTTFAQAGIAAKTTAVSPMGIIVQEGGAVSSLPGFQEGAFYVEDEAAQLIPPLLDPKPGDIILDACAAPGGKATHLAELMRNEGTVLAIDRKAGRVDLLRSNKARLGMSIVAAIVGDIRQPSRWLSSPKMSTDLGQGRAPLIDRILVDAPCSGLGVLRRHPEAKWRKDVQSFSRHQALQLEILRAVVPCLRPGGVLVYSTCSTEREENEDVIERFCRLHAGFRRESVSPWLPTSARRFLTELGDLSTMDNQNSMDGFYAARLKKDE